MTTTTHDNPNNEAKSVSLGRLGPPFMVLGIIGVAICLVLMFSGDHAMRVQMMGSYLFGFVFWMGITLGFFGLTLLHHTVRGNWSVSIIRILEAGGGWISILVMALLLAPLLVNLKEFYVWADPLKVAADPILQYKAKYLNQNFFEIRLVLYVLIWCAYSWFLRRSTLKQDETKNFRLEAGRSSWGAPGMVMFFVTLTFAFTDWVMSLEPHWSSTMFASWTIVSATLGALALSTFIFCVNADKKPFNTVMRPDLTKDLGNMLFTLTMLWGYTSLSQFLIIWNGNLPETASYYMRRSSSVEPMTANFTWGAVGMIGIIGQFFIPFFALITPRAKKTALNLARVAAWIFVVHIADIYLYVIPALPGGRGIKGPLNAAISTDLLAFFAIGAVWVWIFGTQIKRAPVLPLYDNRLQEAAQNAH